MKNQTAHETEMARLGAQRYQRNVLKAKQRGLESTTAPVQRLLEDSINEVTDALKVWMENAETNPGRLHRSVSYLKLLTPDKVAALSCRVILDQISKVRTFTQVARAVASRVADEHLYETLQREHPGWWKMMRKRTDPMLAYVTKRRHIYQGRSMTDDIQYEFWPPGDKIAVGTVMVELFAQTTGLVEITERYLARGRKQLMVVPAESTLRWIEDGHEHFSELTPLLLPCVEPPQDWTDPLDGGYLTSQLRASAMVKTGSRAVVRDLKAADMEPVYRAVNRLQKTGWRVNAKVLDVVRHAWENGIQLADLPHREDTPLPAKPADIETNEDARKKYRSAARVIYDSNIRTRAARLALSQTINTAERFRDKPLWFVYQLDWRGRAYPVSHYLSPQGDDMSKALLTFAEGDLVDTPEARRWHWVHGANCWGLDKASFDEREEWVSENIDRCLEVAEDPLTNRMWEEAADPWQFLAWCFDLKECEDDPDGYRSPLPVHQDATQSGIQIMSLLLRDAEGGRATNCTPTATPMDLYGTVASRLIDLLQDDGSPLALDWVKFGIDRKCCKRPVMTRVYNATKFSASGYVRDWAMEVATEERPIPEGEKPFWFLTEKLWEAMEDVIASTEACQSWMGKVAEAFLEEGKPIRWVTPVGFPVRQSYPRYQSRSIRTVVGEVIRRNRVRIERDKLDRKKMINALAPNVVHSLDSAAMLLTVNYADANGIAQFAAIHDSFGSTAKRAAMLAECIREAYVDLFSPDRLAELRDQFQSQLDTELPAVPEYGSLEIEGLRASPYFFN